MAKYNHIIVGCIILFLMIGCQSRRHRLTIRDVERLAVEVPFIFEGKVIKADGITSPNSQIDRPAAIVIISKILKAPAAFVDYKDQEVTLFLKNSVKEGERAVFFTVGHTFGRGLSVRELGRIESNRKNLQNIAVQSIKQAPARLLWEHAKLSELVVVGRVEEILSPIEQDGEFISEHYPHWRGARIEIMSVESGQYNKQTLVVPFPSSQDVMWWNRPQFKLGQEGIWILHKHSVDPAGKSLFNVVHESDFLPIQSLDFVREVLRNTNYTLEAIR